MSKEHLGGHNGITHLDEGALLWFKELGFKSYLDVGCGPGGMVLHAKKLGFESLGVDGDSSLKRGKKNQSNFILHDFSEGPLQLQSTFDVCWSVEFVEHVYEEFIPNYVQTMQCAKNLVMSHAPKGAPGYHHVNCQDSPYWIAKMKEFGFEYDADMTKKLRSISTMGKKKKHRFIEKTGLFFINENF